MGEYYISGQAILDGIVIRGSKGKATAKRNKNGNIEVNIEKYTSNSEEGKLDKIPILRGIISLVNTIKSGIRSFNFIDDEDSIDDMKDNQKGEDFINKYIPEKFSLYISIFLPIVIFVFIPTLITLLFKYIRISNVYLTIIEGMITLMNLMIYLFVIKQNEMIKYLFKYHGAEHKVINCYEYKKELSIDNVDKMSRLHKRCGTNFLFNTVLVGTILSLPINWSNITVRLLFKLLLLPITIGISYEVIKWIAKSKSKLSVIVAYPGMKLQGLTTNEPTNKEIEVAIMALKASEGISIEKRVDELINEATNILRKNNIESSRLDSQLLLAKVLNKNKLWLITNNDFRVSKENEEEFFTLIEKRKNKMPIKYILGFTEFMGLNLNIKEGVLIPRPDTEILVEEVLKNIEKNERLKVCDLCCGSGAIGLSLASFRKNIEVDLIDIDDIPKDVTISNIEKLDLSNRAKFIQSDLFSNLQEKQYNIIVSNPPYIKNEIIETLMDDVKKYEPHLALAGGDDGLIFYRKIIENSRKYLTVDGILAFEIGHDQGVDVMTLMKENNFTSLEIIKDLAGHDRVVIGKVGVDKEKNIML